MSLNNNEVQEATLPVEKTSLKIQLATFISIICFIAVSTYYVVTYANDTKHELSNKVEKDTFQTFRTSQEYNQRELFIKSTRIEKKLDRLLRKSNIRYKDLFQSDSSDINHYEDY